MYNTLAEVLETQEVPVVRNRFRKNNPSSYMLQAETRLHGMRTNEYFIFPMSRGGGFKPQMCKIPIAPNGVKILSQNP